MSKKRSVSKDNVRLMRNARDIRPNRSKPEHMGLHWVVRVVRMRTGGRVRVPRHCGAAEENLTASTAMIKPEWRKCVDPGFISYTELHRCLYTAKQNNKRIINKT